MPNDNVCYLHIGTEKTGSTTIQKFLNLRRAGLKERGILFPQSPGHENQMRLATYAMTTDSMTDLQAQYGIRSPADAESFQATFAKDFVREIENSTSEICVMSGEHCSSRLIEDEEVERLYQLLSPLFSQIYVVIYLRRQDGFLLSSYSTDVKYGKTAPCTVPTPEEAKERYAYDRLLDRWARVFGRDSLIVRRFDRKRLYKGDVLEDFLNIVAPGKTEGLDRPANENVSLDTETLEWLRLFNRKLPFMVDGQINPMRGNIPILLETISKGPRFSIDHEELQVFMERYSVSNRLVAEHYFDGEIEPEGDPLFGPGADRGAASPAEPLSIERSIEIAAEVWKMKQQQVLDLRRQIKEAQRKA
jgi:hypothetical protein